jgi:type VI secretion system protein ImpH
MATESGTPDAGLEPGGLERDLREDPQAFGFFQAVRLLHRLHPERRRVGGFARPSDEVVRFSVNPSLAFAAGDVQDLHLDPEDSDRPGEMQVNFMGLVGNQGVLPTHYSLLVREERHQDERPLTDFLNMFQHRMLSLFSGAWERSRFYVPFEREEPDRLSARLLDLLGLGQAELRRRMGVRDEAFLFYCGLLGMRQRGAIALEQLLEDYFGVPVEVEQFVGGWYGLSEASQCLVDDEPHEDAAGLGEGTVVGDEVWDPQARVRVRVGPLDRDRYDEFLPGGTAHRAMQAITSFFSDGQFDFDMQLVLARDDVPGVVLGAETDEETLPLGWCTWIRTKPFDRDADETTLSL